MGETMTNNPTIDGVSRELLTNLHKIAYRKCKSAWSAGVCDELRALLDAPAVERQDEVQMASMPVDRCYDVRSKMIIAFNEAKKAGGDLDDALDAAYRSALRFSPAPQDFADQQSTIARLEARITQLESEAMYAAAGYQAARDRIAELESGPGEPFMYGVMRPDGKPHYSELCVSGEASDLEGEAESWTEDGDGVYRVVPLFTAPPAPVAVAMTFEFEHPFSKEKRTVTLKKRDAFDGMEDYFYEKLGEQICQCESVGETNVVDCNCDEYVHDFEIVCACLDATAALNKSP